MNKISKKLMQRIMLMVLIVCMVFGNGIMAYADEAAASTMRLTKAQGTVSVTNKNGRNMGTQNDMKLFNGYQLATSEVSYAWINLDDSKLVKMDAVSEVEIQKKGKDLEILLNSGNLLFNVSESLKADETLNIRTSTMVTGIRGTAGYVKVIDSKRTQVYVLTGRVECSVMDPVSGQVKDIFLNAGQMAEFVVYDQTRAGDKCDIIIGQVTEQNVDGFVAVELINDPELRTTVEGILVGINWNNVAANAENNLVQSEQRVNAVFQTINEQVRQQDNTIVKEPVFGDVSDDDDDDGGGSNPTPPSDPTPPENDDTEPPIVNPVRLTVAQAELDDTLNYYLAKSAVTEVIISSDTEDTLNITAPTTISQNQTVTLEDTVNLEVGSGAELRINGTLNVNGSECVVTNNGTITNTSMNSFIVLGSIENQGVINNTGRIVIGGDGTDYVPEDSTEALRNTGTLSNSGQIEGNIVVTGGTVTLQDCSDETRKPLDRNPIVEGGTVIWAMSELPGSDFPLQVTGGTVELMGGADLVNIESGTLVVSGGAAGEIIVSGGTLRVTAGTVDTILTENETANILVTGGDILEIGMANYRVPAVGNIKVSGGYITSLFTTGVVTFEGGEAANVDVSGDTASFTITDGTIETLTLGINGMTKLSGGTVDDVTAEDCVDIRVDNTFYAETMSITDSQLRMINGTIGELKIENTVSNSAVNEISGGKITNGLVVSELADSGAGTMVEISGGTISAGTKDAAIRVNASVPMNVSDDTGNDTTVEDTTTLTETAEASGQLYNVTIIGGEIESKNKYAIYVEKGYVSIDDTSAAVIKGSQNTQLIYVNPAVSDTVADALIDEYWYAVSSDSEINVKVANDSYQLSRLGYFGEVLAANEYLKMHRDRVSTYDYVDYTIEVRYVLAGEAPTIDLNGYNVTVKKLDFSVFVSDGESVPDAATPSIIISNTGTRGILTVDSFVTDGIDVDIDSGILNDKSASAMSAQAEGAPLTNGVIQNNVPSTEAAPENNLAPEVETEASTEASTESTTEAETEADTEAETGTASDSNADIATDSNAAADENGSPMTPAQAAIPMAAVLFGILAAWPQICESEKKNGKER